MCIIALKHNQSALLMLLVITYTIKLKPKPYDGPPPARAPSPIPSNRRLLFRFVFLIMTRLFCSLQDSYSTRALSINGNSASQDETRPINTPSVYSSSDSRTNSTDSSSSSTGIASSSTDSPVSSNGRPSLDIQPVEELSPSLVSSSSSPSPSLLPSASPSPAGWRSSQWFSQAVRLWATLREPAILLPTAFIFVWQATPHSETAMFYYT